MSAWRRGAACTGQDPRHWDDDGTAHGVLVCGTCPVMSACALAGLRGDEDGVWGGLTKYQRRRLRDAALSDARAALTDDAPVAS